MSKHLKTIALELGNIDKLPKLIIRYGSIAFLSLFALGTLLITINHLRPIYDVYLEFVANSLIKNSFLILAEGVIGGLLIDYAFKKKN